MDLGRHIVAKGFGQGVSTNRLGLRWRKGVFYLTVSP